MALEHGAPTAVIAFAQARCGVAELFPARMRQLDRGAAILRREADLDQLLLPGRQFDDPGKGESMRQLPDKGDPRIGSARTPPPSAPRADRVALTRRDTSRMGYQLTVVR